MTDPLIDPHRDGVTGPGGQDRSRGLILLWLIGRPLIAVGIVLLVISFFLLRMFVIDPVGLGAGVPLGWRIAIFVAVQLGALVPIGCGVHASRLGKQHLVETVGSWDAVASEPFVLYLRTFEVDTDLTGGMNAAPGAWFRTPFELPEVTQEEYLVRLFARHGPMVAVGRPGEPLPALGATRGYLGDDWQTQVSELMSKAHAVILCAGVEVGARRDNGTVWEFLEAVRVVEPQRLVVVILKDRARHEEFRRLTQELYLERTADDLARGRRPAPFPDLPPVPVWPPNKKRWNYPVAGFVTFNADWSQHFDEFDIQVPVARSVFTMRKLIGRALSPVHRRLARLPHGR